MTSTAGTFHHAQRAAELLAEAATELELARVAAAGEARAIGEEFGLLRWRASAVVASLAEAGQYVRAARGHLP